MSQNQNPALTVAIDENEAETSETQPNIVQRVVAPIKKHKKPIIAIVLGGLLVGAAAVSGNKKAMVTVQSPLELDVYDAEDETSSSDDTVTA